MVAFFLRLWYTVWRLREEDGTKEIKHNMAKQDVKTCTPFKTTCGGQALIEGIMMQGPAKRAVVVRKADGELDITEEAIKPRSGLAKLPFFRGLFIFCGSMVHGMKALMHSAEVSDDGSMEEE